MKIAIIGPLCSGKSTLACDLKLALENSEIHEEAYCIFIEKREVVPIAENSTKKSVRQLFEFTVESLKELNGNKTYIVIGTPLNEFMYAVAAMKTSETTDIDITFLNSLKARVRHEMRQFDLILKVEEFQTIPYQFDGVSPNKNREHREFINSVLNELLSVNSHWNVLDAMSLKKVQLVSGSREQRVAQTINYLQLMNRKVLFTPGMPKFKIFSKKLDRLDETSEPSQAKANTILSKL